jgi:hypothetical protein
MRTNMSAQRWVAVVAAFVLALGATRFSAASAGQQDNTGNPSILAAVHAVGAAVASVQNTVNALMTKIDALAGTGESNVRASAGAFAAGGIGAVGVACPVNNVSNASHMVHVELIAGGTILSQQTVTVAAGSTAQVVTGQGQGNVAYCRFTVLDGTRADIRGAMTFGGGFTVTLVVPAD